MKPSKAATSLADKIHPQPFGPPEHLEKICARRKRAVEETARLIDEHVKDLIVSLGDTEQVSHAEESAKMKRAALKPWTEPAE